MGKERGGWKECETWEGKGEGCRRRGRGGGGKGGRAVVKVGGVEVLRRRGSRG